MGRGARSGRACAPSSSTAPGTTWASFALEAGKSVRWVAEMLGHADPALTLRVYAHALRTEEADLAFADFEAPGRPFTAPLDGSHPDEVRDADEADAEYRVLSDGSTRVEVVTQAGVEPATPSFGGWCSIQLSYWATQGVPDGGA